MLEKAKIETEVPAIKVLRFGKTNGDAEILAKTEKEIGYPCFIKPSDPNLLIGVSRARNIHELRQGIVKAFRHDDYIIIEEEILVKQEN